jgi:hypothetical protein
MRRSRIRLAVFLVAALGAAVPLALMAAGPAAATTFPVSLTYINLSGLPEGSITYGTVNDTSGTMTWTLNGFTSGGVTYTPVGISERCWDSGGTGNNCDGFGNFAQGVTTPGVFANPATNSDNGDTNGGFVAHAKWNASNGTNCTGFIGSFPGTNNQFATSGNSANSCASLTPVPEPGSALLMLTGLPGIAGLVFMRKRQFAGPKA